MRPSGVTLSDLATGTHSFTVAARGVDGDEDATPASRQWAIPLNNTQLTHSAGWRRRSGSGYYLRSFSETSKRRASLSFRVEDAREVALVASRGPNFGTVQLFLGRSQVGQVNLASRTLKKRVLIPMATFGSARSGTLKLVVSSANKPVRIEGLGVR